MASSILNAMETEMFSNTSDQFSNSNINEIFTNKHSISTESLLSTESTTSTNKLFTVTDDFETKYKKLFNKSPSNNNKNNPFPQTPNTNWDPYYFRNLQRNAFSTNHKPGIATIIESQPIFLDNQCAVKENCILINQKRARPINAKKIKYSKPKIKFSDILDMELNSNNILLDEDLESIKSEYLYNTDKFIDKHLVLQPVQPNLALKKKQNLLKMNYKNNLEDTTESILTKGYITTWNNKRIKIFDPNNVTYSDLKNAQNWAEFLDNLH